ncbi:Zinc finger RING/FYVE/PHD-type protein [Dioscorea alata]|uniref:Zinc finger RING/FYVE/PHD-type protein n=1 Tax=Dioscorea alata TaxID=55571 RepID=A0ACB7UZB9_DIOAL|nr:Zinc finger RING/FYVE/PHD-type protein [Dioscorea alata]
MLPGVELARRRRVHHHHYDLPRRAPSDPKPVRYAATAPAPPDRSDMDEPALLARARLEEKLRRFSGPPRWKNNNRAEVRNERVEREAERNSSEDQKGGSTSLVMLKRRDSRVNVCAVCLDEVEMMRSSVQRIYKKKEIMKLPCSHIYHSDCLLPWLANNSHCPCCRTIVPSSFIL